MPYMLRLTWQGVALHGGHLPGYPASHGCIRLPHEFAPRVFETVRLGEALGRRGMRRQKVDGAGVVLGQAVLPGGEA